MHVRHLEQDEALPGQATFSRRAAERSRRHGVGDTLHRFTSVVGGFYLLTAGINAGLALGRPELYRAFAGGAPFAWVRDTWAATFGVHPAGWALGLAAGEAVLGTALLGGGRWAVAGYAGVVAFHVGLLAFGPWAWAWAVPVLAVVVPVGLRYRRRYREGA